MLFLYSRKEIMQKVVTIAQLVTSVAGKMLEAIIARAIRKHLDEHKLIRHNQYGFSKGKSCLTNLLSFYRKVFETIDKWDEYNIVYLDFSKAFDSIPVK